MSKRHLMLSIMVAALVTATVCVLNIDNKRKRQPVKTVPTEELTDENSIDENIVDEKITDDDDTDVNYVLTEFTVNKQVQPKDIKRAGWISELLSDAKGKAYYFAEDYTHVIFTDDHILVEDPSIRYVQLDTIGHLFNISLGEKNVIVDFSDPRSVRQLDALNSGVTSDFVRQLWRNVANFCNKVFCAVEIDIPKTSTSNRHHINRWLGNIALAYHSSVAQVPVSPPTYLTYKWENQSKYKGSLEDRDSINKFIANEYFKEIKAERGTNEENYPPKLYSNLSLRAHYLTKRYVTYQMVTSGYDGGAHGYTDVQLISFDHVNHLEIGWNYIFKPGNEEQILKVFEKAAKKNELYQQLNANLLTALQIEDDDGRPSGKIMLPLPALTPMGVTISYEPYEAGYIAGSSSISITVPYNQLRPYLTDRAKQCAGLR